MIKGENAYQKKKNRGQALLEFKNLIRKSTCVSLLFLLKLIYIYI